MFSPLRVFNEISSSFSVDNEIFLSAGTHLPQNVHTAAQKNWPVFKTTARTQRNNMNIKVRMKEEKKNWNGVRDR
jgi:hypothetical protein